MIMYLSPGKEQLSWWCASMTGGPRLLILETSGRVGQVAVAEGPQLRGCRRLDETRRHARDLAPAVADLLCEQRWKPRAVQGLLVSRGPGSYTGLRVGIASALAFAYATGCAVLAIDTFAAIALQAPAEAAALAVLSDAQQDQVYVQHFVRAGESWQASSALQILPLQLVLAHLDPAIWLTGPALYLHGASLAQRYRLVRADRWDPQVDSVLALGLARYQRGERDDPWKLEPLYARPSAAERQWQERSALGQR